tara:strand:+ start:112875 stop:113066 length:192 start_codon:yes stop_codon:yes gene_type:complete
MNDEFNQQSDQFSFLIRKQKNQFREASALASKAMAAQIELSRTLSPQSIELFEVQRWDCFTNQ